ncbi:MAG: terminase large subunit domain-containing protein [Elusimicrobiota bacterium]
MQLDSWQKEVLKTDGDICLRAGRQVGKSTVVSMKAGEYAANNRNKLILVIAAVDRQSKMLLEKIKAYMEKNHKRLIKRGKEKPTQHKIRLRNGSKIYCFPTGRSGYGIRGYSIDLLIADEAAFIPEEVWTAITPSLAATKGNMILLSTPHTKKGFFYECFEDENFSSFHISSEDCDRIPDDFLEKEKKRMTKAQYQREYKGEFTDELAQYFPTSIIEKCMNKEREKIEKRSRRLINYDKYYLGVDLAGRGGDENAFVIVKQKKDDTLEMVDLKTTTADEIEGNITVDTINRIKLLERIYNFNKIYLDDAGLGSPIYDQLLTEDEVKRKLVGLNNARKSITADGKRKRRLLKEDLYGNLLRLMQQKKIKLLDDDNLRLSLKSVEYEINEDGSVKIDGSYTHITEALIRAAWGVQGKDLNIWIR